LAWRDDYVFIFANGLRIFYVARRQSHTIEIKGAPFKIFLPERTIMRALIAAPLLFLASGFLFAQHTSAPEGEEGHLIALETAWNHAEQSKDAHALDQLLAESLVYIDYDGTLMNKKEYLASTLKSEVQGEQINNDGMTAHIYGNAAVVTGTYRDKGVEKGKAFLRRGRFTDTWIYDRGAWQCVASQSTLISH
jgi:hypothetical protein